MTRKASAADHSLSLWEATDDAGLAIVVKDAGHLSVWELGLFGEDDGFRTMAALATRLCESHNAALLSSGREVESADTATGRGSAMDRSREKWAIGYVRLDGESVPGVDTPKALVTVLGNSGEPTPDMESEYAIAERMVRLHNGLLAAGVYGKES